MLFSVRWLLLVLDGILLTEISEFLFKGLRIIYDVSASYIVTVIAYELFIL